MKFLVTGGAGFIGSNLCHHLIAQNHQVLCVDKLTYAGNRNSIADLEDNPNFELFVADICNADAMHKAIHDFGPDAVMHLAAESHVDRSIDGPGDFIQTNIVGTFTLLQAARSYYSTLVGSQRDNFRFLHVSTDEVYGSLGDTGLFTEETPYDPHSPYSASKAASDHLVRAWSTTYGLPTIVTNCSNNYGPYQFPEKLIPVVIIKALRGEPIPVYGQGLNVRDWLHVEDHCLALMTVVMHGTPGETYNIGGNNELRNIDLVTQLCNILDEVRPRADGGKYSELITYVSDRPGHDLRYAIDASKIARDLSWHPKHDTQTGLKQTVDWYIKNEPWWTNLANTPLAPLRGEGSGVRGESPTNSALTSSL